MDAQLMLSREFWSFFLDEDIWRDEKSSCDPIDPYFETESVVYPERKRKSAKADCQWDGCTHCIV